MGVFEEGDMNCIKNLLKPVERVLREGLDVIAEDFERRRRLWEAILENYDRYLDGECGEFLRDLDMHFRSKFEGALALLAWSFWKNEETFAPALRRFREKELVAVERVLRYNVFEIYSKDDVMKMIMRRDKAILEPLREYYHGVDRWIEDVLNDPTVKLPLRNFLKEKWDSYKGKVNAAVAEATQRFDWLRDFLAESEEEKESIEKVYRKRIEELRRQLEEMRQRFEREKRELRERIESAKEAEIDRLRREKEELIRQFEEERQRLVEEISRMKDEEARKLLEEELRKAREEMMRTVEALEDEIRRKELQLKEKEMELRKKELELKEKEDVISRRIKEVMELAGKLEKGSRFVRMDEARIMEMNFMGRMRSKFKGELRLLGKTFKVESVEERPTFDKSGLKLSERDLKNVPDNRVLEVKMREKKLLGKKEELTVKAMFYSRPERYADMGFDTDPLELADVNALLVDARDDAKTGRVVLLVASPTGFEKRIVNYVNSSDFHRNFISENVSLALLDLESGELIYNPHDEYAKAFEPFLRLERDEELLAKVKEFLEYAISRKGYVRLEEAVEHFSEDLVKKAFHELSRERGYRTKYVDGVGYVLVREGFL